MVGDGTGRIVGRWVGVGGGGWVGGCKVGSNEGCITNLRISLSVSPFRFIYNTNYFYYKYDFQFNPSLYIPSRICVPI